MNETTLSYLNVAKDLSAQKKEAEKALQGELLEKLTEAANLYIAYKEYFGTKPSLPPNVAVFKVNEQAVPAKKRTRKAAGTTEDAAPANGKKIGALRRALATQQAKLNNDLSPAAKQAVEDRIYEITDELRLLGVVIGVPSDVTNAAEVSTAAASGSLDLE